METLLFSQSKLGRITLKNRVVMAPMTRSRAIGYIPNGLMAQYYALRSEAGLLITEGTSPSPNGLGYARIPGLYNEEHVAGWRKVTDAVHANGGRIFVQLMHTGRVSHPLNMPKDSIIMAPSAIALSGQMWTDQQQMQPHPTPLAMSLADIKTVIGEFVTSSRLAIEAGFDGVELHGANGYLIDQFINTASNKRTDQYGGSDENRIRFAVEIAHAVSNAIGADRVGMRVSPYGVFNDMVAFENTDQTYELLAKKLSDLGLIYVHVVDHASMGAPEVRASVKSAIRKAFKGTYILSGGYDAVRAEHDLKEGKGDLVAFGRPYISNPRLVEKLRTGAKLHEPDSTTFYTPGEKGYTDYPLE